MHSSPRSTLPRRRCAAFTGVVVCVLGASVVSISACDQDLPAFSIDDASTGNDATSSDGAVDSADDTGNLIAPDARADGGTDSMSTADSDADIADAMGDAFDG